jgi:Heterokaryon incompatibility protein (HET)
MSRSTLLPRRLVEITKSSTLSTSDVTDYTVRLVDTNCITGSVDYVALSHCWGPPGNQTKTLTTNIEEFQRPLSLSRLAPLFQDVVRITRTLGFKYLWVDSMCIIQDSDEDWQTESSQMANIYQNSVITISATQATSSSVPLLPNLTEDNLGYNYQDYIGNEEISCLDRITQLQTRSPLYFSVYCPLASSVNSTLDQIYVSYNFKRTYSLDKSRFESAGRFEERPDKDLRSHFGEPLQSRGWCVQERILSPRKIFFGSKQLFWECRTKRNFENWTNNISQILDPHTYHRYLANLDNRIFETIPGLVSQNLKQCYNWWYDLLNGYGSKKFTFEADLLPGLGGIAQRFSEETNDRYLAGIWQSDLFRGLTWRIEQYSNEYRILLDIFSNESKMGSMPRPISDCYAPSWSWASMWGYQRSFLRGQSLYGDATLHHTMTWDNRSKSIYEIEKPLPRPNPRLIKVHIEPLTSATSITGRLKYALLEIEALCTDINVTLKKKTLSNPHGLGFEMPLKPLPEFLYQYLYVCIDYPSWLRGQVEEVIKRSQSYMLTCALMRYTSGLHCILLRKEKDEDEYQRCGVVNIEYKAEEFLRIWDMRRVVIR